MTSTCRFWNSTIASLRKAVEVERVRWIRVVHGQIRWIDLIPVAVFLAPEDPAPRLVESLKRAVPVLQPGPKGGGAGRPVAAGRVALAPFVVDLPADHRLVLTIPLGHRLRDPAGVLAVNRAGMVVVLAGAEVAGAALRIDRQDLRMLLDQPWRGRAGWGAENDARGPGRRDFRSRGPANPTCIARARARCATRRTRRSAPRPGRARASGSRRGPIGLRAIAPGNSRHRARRSWAVNSRPTGQLLGDRSRRYDRDSVGGMRRQPATSVRQIRRVLGYRAELSR